MPQYPLGLLVIFFFSFSSQGMAQSLPSSMIFIPEEHRLETNARISTGVYDESIIRTIELQFDQPDYWTLLLQNKATQTDIPATMTVDGQTFPNVGVRFKGQTSFMNVQNSQKKSFNITLNYQNEDQNWDGYETLNLNNAFEDRSFMREVLYLHLIRRHIPAAKACYVRLKINGEDWGLYPHVQQVNGEFIKEWFFSNDGSRWRADAPTGIPGIPGGPMWGDGTAGLNYLGPDTTQYQKYYTLKNSDQENPWQDLVNVCDALNTTPLDQLAEVIPDYLDLDRTLWFLASEILFTDDDSYVYKGRMDYYVYWDPETGRMTPLEFDGNSPMAANRVSWSPFYNEAKVNYPLMNRLFAVPEIRQRYLAHFRTLMQDAFTPAAIHAMLEDYKTLISAEVQSDPKKLYTYANFLNDINVLKDFFSNRYTFLTNHQEIAQPAPLIAEVVMESASGEWQNPEENEEVAIRTLVTSTNGIFEVRAYWSDQLTGNFSYVVLYDDGAHGDGAALDGIYGNTLPGMAADSWVRFYIEATANNPSKTVSYFPAGAEHDVFMYQVQRKALVETDLVINEIMASNTMTVTDEAGQYEDWIEFFNKGTDTIDISGYYLSDKLDNLTDWTFPADTRIAPGAYLIVWADEDKTQGPMHADFKLSMAGEGVYLSNPAAELVAEVLFGAQETDKGYARIPNGTGDFVIQDPTFGTNNEGISAHEDHAVNTPTWSLSPNPANTHFFLVADDVRHVEIVNSLGQSIWTGNVEPGTPVNTSSWPEGFYIARSGISIQPVIIQH